MNMKTEYEQRLEKLLVTMLSSFDTILYQNMMANNLTIDLNKLEQKYRVEEKIDKFKFLKSIKFVN